MIFRPKTKSRWLGCLNSSLVEPALVKFRYGLKLSSYGEKPTEEAPIFQISLNHIEADKRNAQNAKQVSLKITLLAFYVLVLAYLSKFFYGFCISVSQN